MTSANDPREVLQKLISGAELPFPAEEVEKARELAKGPAYARAAEVEVLPEPLALAVLEASVRDGHSGLAEVLSGSGSKSLAKAAKKALYQLRSKGVAVPEKKAAPEAAASAHAPAPGKLEAPASLVSAITGNGERAVIVGNPMGAKVEALQMVIGDEHGVVHLRVSDLSRGQYRKMLKDAGRADAPSVVEFSLEEARELVAEAAGTNLRSKTPFPSGMELALSHLGVRAWESPRELPEPLDGDQGLAVSGASLHDEPEISQWLPPIDALRELALKAQEIAVSPLYLDEDQRAQQLHQTMQSLAEKFFTEPMRKLYARRLWHMAELFDRSDRSGPATIARAEARRLFHGAPGLFTPFGVKLFEKVLSLSGPQPARPTSQPAEEPRLIIT